MKKINMIGKKYNRLTILKEVAERTGSRDVRYLAKCDCGIEKIVSGRSVRRGKTKSCGCLNIENLTSHGLSRTQEYNVWRHMLQRCNDPKDKEYHRYGARDIKVCDRWQDVTIFCADMGKCPDGCELDRIDNNRGYEPNNCRWVTSKENNQNTSKSKIWAIEGKEFSSSNDAAKYFGVSQGTIVNWCNGYMSHGKYWHEPKDGCYSFLKYKGDEQ